MIQWRWHIDKVFMKINAETHNLWRAVDHEGELVESFVTKTRDKTSALKFLKKATRRYGRPEEVVTDKLRSYRPAMNEVGSGARQVTGRRVNNRMENSHLPFLRRELAMVRFRRMRSLQKFAAADASIHNHDRSLARRPRFEDHRSAVLTEWGILRVV